LRLQKARISNSLAISAGGLLPFRINQTSIKPLYFPAEMFGFFH